MGKTYKAKYRVHDIVYYKKNNDIIKDEIVSVKITDEIDGVLIQYETYLTYFSDSPERFISEWRLHSTREEAEKS